MKKTKLKECLALGFVNGAMSLMFVFLPQIELWVLPLMFAFLFTIYFMIPILGEGGAASGPL